MLEDSSFAIHPTKENRKENISFYPIGNLLSIKQEQSYFTLRCEKGFVRILFYRDDIVRIIMNPHAVPSLTSSIALIKKQENVAITMQENPEFFLLTTKKLQVQLQKTPLRIHVYDNHGNKMVSESLLGMGYTSNRQVFCYKDLNEEDHFYGFGEKTGFLDKRGEKMTMWNSDVFTPHNPATDALYQSIPYFMTVKHGRAHGIFLDNTFQTFFDFKSMKTAYSFGAEDGQLDYYILAGPSPKDVLEQYTTLTGRMPLPPKWALGYHQSKYSYKSDQEVREIARKFKEKQIPIDAIYLDIHYMNGFRVFTFDPIAFPNPRKLISDLKSIGIHIVPIVDPGIKKDPTYPIYKEGILEKHFCKYLEGDVYVDEVWAGLSAFPDFSNKKTQKWWANNHVFYTALGIEGIWNDMNEPAVFNETKTMDLDVIHENDGNLKTHQELHNIYGLLMNKATYEGLQSQLKGKRPFLLTRAGFAGVQRFAAVWTGDNRSFWEHLEMSLPMCMNLSLSGVAFCGVDIGGFAHDCTGQLLTRWMQVGAFMPFFRNHNALDTIDQEPWAFGETYESIIKKYIQLRYKWLPHLYTLFREASKTGSPVMRPFIFEFPNDPNVYNLSDQFLLGDNVLIAPILRPDTFHRVVYLPEGDWVNYWTDEVITGKQHILVEAPLDLLPIFVKKGTMIAHGSVKQSTKEQENDLQIHLYLDRHKNGNYTLYDDDGKTFSYEKGDYYLKNISYHCSNDCLFITITNIVSSYTPNWKDWTLNIHLIDDSLEIIVNDKKIPYEDLRFDPTSRLCIIKLSESV